MRRTDSAEKFARLDTEINEFPYSVNSMTVNNQALRIDPAPRFWTFVFAHEMCGPNLEDSFIDWSADAKSYFCSAKSTTSAYSRSENPALPAEIPHL